MAPWQRAVTGGGWRGAEAALDRIVAAWQFWRRRGANTLDPIYRILGDEFEVAYQRLADLMPAMEER